MPRILVVEDDAPTAELIRLQLERAGCAVTAVGDGAAALRALEQDGWQAVVLDLGLPDIDGLDLCRRLRARAHYTPIIIVSTRASEVDRVLGLELGADDYLAKPFSSPELVARVRALVRRTDAILRSARLDSGELERGGLRIDPIGRIAELDARRLELTAREFDLLYFLVRHTGEVYSRLDLLREVWGYRHAGYEHTVNTHVNRLRQKLEADPSRPRRLLTVWGRGYTYAA